jgi:hypothetical protein
LLPSSSCHSSTTTSRTCFSSVGASARASSRLSDSGVVTRPVGQRFCWALRSLLEVSPVRAARVQPGASARGVLQGQQGVVAERPHGRDPQHRQRAGGWGIAGQGLQRAQPHGQRLARAGAGVQQARAAGGHLRPDLALEAEGLPAARLQPGLDLGLSRHRGPPRSWRPSGPAAFPACRPRAGLVLAPAQHARKAHRQPLLWRALGWMPSKPSSNSSVGRSRRTGPNFSSVVWRTTRSTRRISSSLRPE